MTENYDGRPLRRVIKVDTSAGLVREHVIYDHERNPLIRATIRSHRKFEGYLLPQSLVITFPAMNMELDLQFGTIRPNCSIDRSLWELPEGTASVVDLGDIVRRRVQPPVFSPDAAPVSDRKWTPDHTEVPAPEFDMDATGESVPLQPEWDAPPQWDAAPAGGSRRGFSRMGRTPGHRFGWPLWPFRR